jgi:hypothetical protein
VAEYRLDGFIVHAQGMKVCRKATPEGVPTVSLGKGTVALRLVTLWLVFFLGLSANSAARKRGNNHPPSEIVKV